MLALVLSLALFLAGNAHASDDKIKFDVEAQSATRGVLRFAQQADLAVLFPRDVLTPYETNEVVGEYTVQEGLERLLAGSPLRGEITNSGALLVDVAHDGEPTRESGSQMNTQSSRTIRNALKSGAGGLGAVFAALAAANAQEGADQGADDVSAQDTIFVTGTRSNRPRTVAESPIPIDVFSSEQLERQPQTGIFESLRFLVPSLNFPQRAGGGTATFIASAGLRGLNPDQTLVLVNGKRRHKTALINTSTGLFSGSAGVDLNLIPGAAIERIEVLRDGAAAQYGSDAIAGVVNIILKDDAGGGRVSALAGQNYDRGDGEYVNLDFNAGFGVGENGFVNVSFGYVHEEQSNRARPVPIPDDPANPGGLNLFPILPGPELDPREFTIDRLVTTNFGNFPQRTATVGVNAGYDLGGVELYVFGTYGNRDSELDFTFRRPRDSRNTPEIFPFGFRPEELIEENDFEVVGGLRGENYGFSWDLSAGYGKNITDWSNTRGLNASLGVDSPTSFFLGGIDASEFTASFDATTQYDVGQGTVDVSFGVQYREESFEIRQGEPLSFADGNNGDAPGAQGFPGFAPEAVTDVSRDNVNGYVEVGWDPTDRLFLGAALRYESYSDSAGEELVWKVNGRYELTDWLALRASYNTGFRAPSIQQLGFKGSRGQFVDLDDDGIAETIVLRQTLPSTDPAAQALGAEPLTPELSDNVSFGFSLTRDAFSLTVDAYQIDVEDRIALSTQFNRGDGRAAQGGGTIGEQISTLLDAAGFDESLGGVNYFTNAIDTRSRGVDVVATWSDDFDAGSLSLSAAFNYNDTTVESVDPNPPELAGLILADGAPIVQFDRARLGTYTEEIPETKTSIAANLDAVNGVRVSVRGTRFGSFTEVQTSAQNDRFNESKWIFDLELGYDFGNGLGFYAGANNIFNTYPDETRAANSLGTNFYDTISPYGFTGGNYYLRTEYSW